MLSSGGPRVGPRGAHETPPAARRARARPLPRAPRPRRAWRCGRRALVELTGMVRSRIVRSAAVAAAARRAARRAAEHDLVQVEGADDGRQHVAEPARRPRRAPPGPSPARRAARAAAAPRARSPGSRVREQAHSLAVGVDDDVADLAGGAERWPCSSEPLEHQAGADTGADPQHHQPAVAGVAEGVLAERRRCWRRWRRTPAASSVVARGRSASGTSVQPRLGASTTVPSASTTPGLPTPTPSTGRSVVVDQLGGQAVDERRPRRSPRAVERASSRRGPGPAPERLSTRAGHRGPSADRSRPTIWRASAARPTSVGRLADPALRRGAPSSVEQPLGDQVADQVGDRHPGQPAGAGQVGPAGRAVAEQLLEQQRPVVAAGVLRKQLAAGPERPADRGDAVSHLLVQRTYLSLVKGFASPRSPVQPPPEGRCVTPTSHGSRNMPSHRGTRDAPAVPGARSRASGRASPTARARRAGSAEEGGRAVPAHGAQPLVPQAEPGQRLELDDVGVGDVREVAAEQHLPASPRSRSRGSRSGG